MPGRLHARVLQPKDLVIAFREAAQVQLLVQLLLLLRVQGCQLALLERLALRTSRL